MTLLAAEDLDHSFYEKKSKGSFGRKSFRSDQVTRITQQGTEITTGGDLALISGGDQTYQAASQGASPEEVNQALRAMARGEGFEGPDPAQAFLKAWATAMLTGGGVISHTAKGVTLVLGGALGGGANVSYQITNKDLEALNITDAAVATAVGALTQGKGLAGSVGVNMGGAYIGSQVKGTDAGSAVVGAGVGSVLGHGAGKILGDKAKAITPGGAGESLGALGGAISSEVVSDKIGSLLGGGEN